MYNEQELTGKQLLKFIQTHYLDQIGLSLLPGSSYFFKAAEITEARNFLESRKTINFLTDNAAAFAFIQIFLSGLRTSGIPELLPMNALDIKHSFSYFRINSEDILLSFFSQLCEKFFNTSGRVALTQDSDADISREISLEIQAFMYFQKTSFFTAPMFGLLRKMLNPKEGVIALRILNESNIAITPAIRDLLFLTIQPAHLARVLHYINTLGELNDTNIALLTSAVQTWESGTVNYVEHQGEHERSIYFYFHRIKGLAMVLQSLSFGAILTKDKFNFLMAPARHSLLEAEDFFDILYTFSVSKIGFPSIIWDNLVANYDENNAALIQQKIGALNVACYHFQSNLLRIIIIKILLRPENNAFLIGDYFAKKMIVLKALIKLFYPSLLILEDGNYTNNRSLALENSISFFVAFLRNNPSDKLIESVITLLDLFPSEHRMDTHQSLAVCVQTPVEHRLATCQSILALAQSANAELKIQNLHLLINHLKQRNAWIFENMDAVIFPDNTLFLENDLFGISMDQISMLVAR